MSLANALKWSGGPDARCTIYERIAQIRVVVFERILRNRVRGQTQGGQKW